MFMQLIAFILILFLFYLYFRCSREGRLMAKIPGPKGIPFFGNTFDVMKSPDKVFKFIRETNKKYGDFSKLQAFGTRVVNIYNPDDVEKVLSTNRYNEKQLPYTFLSPWLSQGLLLSNGEKWQQRRKLLTTSFHFNILKHFARTFVQQWESFFDKLEEEEVGKEKTHLQPLLSLAMLEVMCATAFGTSMHAGLKSVTNKYFHSILSFGNTAAYRITRILLHNDVIFNLTKTAKRQKKDVERLQDLTHKIINERKEYLRNNKVVEGHDDFEGIGKKTRLAMLDLLLKKQEEGEIDYDGIREEVDTFMFEGHDTCAMAHCYLMMRIANEPRVQELIHEEQQRIFGNSRRAPTIEDLNDMKYLECCIKESLRLHSSAPLISRYITEDVVLSGHTVPANTQIYIHIYDLHRRPEMFPEPEKFTPERFLPENTNKRHPYAYIPFSAGPRNCIGQKFAMLEMKTFMSGLMRRFRLEPVTRPEDVVYKIDILLRTNEPIYVRLRSRK